MVAWKLLWPGIQIQNHDERILMKYLAKTLLFLTLSASAYAQSPECQLNALQALNLNNTLEKVDHAYSCAPSGPSLGTPVQGDLGTCLISGTSSESFGGGPALFVVSKKGFSNMLDGLIVGSLFGVHVNGRMSETVQITAKSINVSSVRSSPVQTQILVNLENGQGSLSSEDSAAELKFQVPVQCHEIPLSNL